MKKNKIIPLILFAGYIFLENKILLRVRHEDLGGNIKIAHISDLHKRRFGENNSRICRIVSEEKPDIICITGDIISRNETDFSAVEILLKNLCKISPVYMICGNHEQSVCEGHRDEFFSMIERTGAVMLMNESSEINIKKRTLHIYGLKEDYTTYKNAESYRNLSKITYNDMNKLLGNSPAGNTILLAHSPFFAEVYSQWGADFTLSGHVHGGVVRIFGRGILSPERKLFPRYSKGVYDINGMKLLVSGGLGKFRLFNPPEIVIYRI